MDPGPPGAEVDTHEPGPGPTHWVERPVEVALLDLDGVIVSVNDAWTTFGAVNGGDPLRTGVGMSYLDICDGASSDPATRRIATAVRTALGGDLPAPLRVEVPCHGPHASHWFDVLISSRFDDDGGCRGATVTLSLVRSAPAVAPSAASAAGDGPGDGADDATRPAGGSTMPAFYPERSERLGDVFAQLLMERAPLGILVVDDHGTVVLAGRAAEALFGCRPDGLCGSAVTDLLPEVGPLTPGVAASTPSIGGAAIGGGTISVAPPRLVDAVRSDGTHLPVELRHGHLPLSRGTGSVLLFRAVPVPGPGPHVVLDHDIDDILARLERVVRHLVSCESTAVGAAAAHRADHPLAATLHRVAADLDGAVQEIRSVALRLQGPG